MSKHPEERIDQVLNALRDAAPPIGLEARIVSRLARTGEVRTETPSRLGAVLNAAKKTRVVFSGVTLYAFAGATLALLVAIFSIMQVSYRSSHPVAQARPLPVQAKPYTPAEQFTLAQTRPSVQALPNGRLQHAHSLPPSQAARTDPDTIAMAETLAPSHPAPPMPPTQQERLMLNVLRSGDQEEIAALDPVERDALLAQDQAAFQNFFAPHIPAPMTGEKE